MIQTLILVCYNLVRGAVNRVRWGRRYSVHAVCRVAPKARLCLFGEGRLSIGRNVEIAPYSEVLALGRGEVSIGAGTYMNRFCLISCHEQVSIGEGCMFGPGVKIFDNNHRFSQSEGVLSDLSTAPVTIGNNCWLASDVVVLKGASIGDRCVIGAGCIISGFVPAGSIVRRNPEQIIEPLR